MEDAVHVHDIGVLRRSDTVQPFGPWLPAAARTTLMSRVGAALLSRHLMMVLQPSSTSTGEELSLTALQVAGHRMILVGGVTLGSVS